MDIRALETLIDYSSYQEKTTYIYHTMKGFMKYNPPCKECLVKTMCIVDKGDLHTLDCYPFDCLTIKSPCEELRSFLRKQLHKQYDKVFKKGEK